MLKRTEFFFFFKQEKAYTFPKPWITNFILEIDFPHSSTIRAPAAKNTPRPVTSSLPNDSPRSTGFSCSNSRRVPVKLCLWISPYLVQETHSSVLERKKDYNWKEPATSFLKFRKKKNEQQPYVWNSLIILKKPLKTFNIIWKA